MICDWCGCESGALSYDVECGFICPRCRSKVNAQIRPRRCPFCNGHDLTIIHDEMGPYEYVFCNYCKACGPASDTPLEAVKEWNAATRARA